MKIAFILIIGIIVCACKKDKVVLVEEVNNSIKAIGTCHGGGNVDKNICSDFQLVLEIDKAAYLYKEPIPTKL